MNSSILLIFLVVFFQFSAAQDFSTCARMGVPVLEVAARGLCITSCTAQNCGTGNCEKRGGRPTCVCSRCADGAGGIPLIALITRRRGRK